MGEDFRLKWNDHHSIFFSRAEQLCHGDQLTDVTLSCGAQEFSAHKLVLSICSSYFSQLFAPPAQSERKRRPADSAAIVYLRGVDPKHMELLLNYMYRGEINVEENELMDFLATAKSLQVKGLTESAELEDLEEPKVEVPVARQTKKRGAASKVANTSNNLSKKIKQEASLSSSHVMTPNVESYEEDHSNAGSGFMEPSGDPIELTDQDTYNDQAPESMVYEGDPENPGELQPSSAFHSQPQTAAKREVNADESVGEAAGSATDMSESSVVILKEPTHTCFACPKAFVHKWMLERHILTHTGEQPYSCSICLRRFSLQASCLRHVRHVHKDAQGLLSNYVLKVSNNGLKTSENTPMQ